MKGDRTVDEIATMGAYLHAKARGMRGTGRAASPRTIAAYRDALTRAERLLEMELADMYEDEADELMELMDDLSPATVAQTISALRGFFDWAIVSGRYRGHNPFALVTPKTVERKIPIILTREQIKRFFEVIESEKYRMFFSLMYFGGLRIGEVTRLLKEDLREDGIVVRGKGNKMRFVPLPERILNDLKDYIAKSRKHGGQRPYVFGSDSNAAKQRQPMNPSKAYQVFKQAVIDAELPEGTHTHNLRHTSATHFHQATQDLAKTQKFLGHVSPATTIIYAQIADEELKRASKAAFGE